MTQKRIAEILIEAVMEETDLHLEAENQVIVTQDQWNEIVELILAEEPDFDSMEIWLKQYKYQDKTVNEIAFDIMETIEDTNEDYE